MGMFGIGDMLGIGVMLGMFSIGIFMSFIIEAQQSFDWVAGGGSARIIEWQPLDCPKSK
jgi:hypothetical protein